MCNDLKLRAVPRPFGSEASPDLGSVAVAQVRFGGRRPNVVICCGAN